MEGDTAVRTHFAEWKTLLEQVQLSLVGGLLGAQRSCQLPHEHSNRSSLPPAIPGCWVGFGANHYWLKLNDLPGSDRLS